MLIYAGFIIAAVVGGIAVSLFNLAFIINFKFHITVTIEDETGKLDKPEWHGGNN